MYRKYGCRTEYPIVTSHNRSGLQLDFSKFSKLCKTRNFELTKMGKQKISFYIRTNFLEGKFIHNS